MNLFLILFGLYLLAVAFEGNAGELWSFLLSQKAFLWWEVAVLFLWGLWTVSGSGKTVIDMLAVIVFTAFVLNAVSKPAFGQQFQQLKLTLGG